ncbi:hypothetical protein DER46DRAFT_614319 [Fusarium sp. MPI-SDFR-AT-0072]|nr:hypothetical protein DER46DRAFT_614319 [Fusarium sp. MPI-SDFR-AT-0072]
MILLLSCTPSCFSLSLFNTALCSFPAQSYHAHLDSHRCSVQSRQCYRTKHLTLAIHSCKKKTPRKLARTSYSQAQELLPFR